MKNSALKKLWGPAIGLLVCIPAGVFWEGLIFVGTAFFVFLPRLPMCRWYEVALGALISGIAAVFAGDAGFMFWGLLAVALAALSLQSLWKTLMLSAAALALMKLDAGGVIYVATFVGIIWNAILAFTYEEIYDKIKEKNFERVDNFG